MSRRGSDGGGGGGGGGCVSALAVMAMRMVEMMVNCPNERMPNVNASQQVSLASQAGETRLATLGLAATIASCRRRVGAEREGSRVRESERERERRTERLVTLRQSEFDIQ